MIYWGKQALTLGPREAVALATLIITHLYAVSSRQRSRDRLRCEEELICRLLFYLGLG